MTYASEELLIAAIAHLIEGMRHIAVGLASPIPGSAALLAKAQATDEVRVSILGHAECQVWSDTGSELFDCAAQGRIDAFFLGGGQIDGAANINLVGVGDYPHQRVRWAGSFGSAFLYYVVPRVILFREEHSRRVMVPKVDFISAPGSSDPKVYRPGGPHALVTNLCLFRFDKATQRFRLDSVHPGHSVEEVRDNTGFDFDVPDHVPQTPIPCEDTLRLMRSVVADEISVVYPRFAARVFGSVTPGQGAAPASTDSP